MLGILWFGEGKENKKEKKAQTSYSLTRLEEVRQEQRQVSYRLLKKIAI